MKIIMRILLYIPSYIIENRLLFINNHFVRCLCNQKVTSMK